jgi:hypothetical protein
MRFLVNFKAGYLQDFLQLLPAGRHLDIRKQNLYKNLEYTEYCCTFVSEMKKSANSPNLKSVFANVTETRERKALFDVFITDSVTSAAEGDTPIASEYRGAFEKWIGEYDQIVHQFGFLETLQRLRNLEVAILMYRSMVSPAISVGEMKLNRHGSEKSYAFVRSPFFAPDNVKNEIRVYMGTIEELGKSVEELRKDSKFLDSCEKAVIHAMRERLSEHSKKMTK